MLVGVVMILRPLHESTEVAASLLLVLLLAAFAAVATGLLISALARSEDQATAIIPLVMIAQLLFGGAIVTIHNMGEAMRVVSSLVAERWAFAGAGTAIHLNERIHADAAMKASNPYGDSFFDLSTGRASLILIGFVAVLVAGTLVALRRTAASG
jgi:ABC-type multidrug transport system permease subunit